MPTGGITLSIESQFENIFLVGQAINKIVSSIPVSEKTAFEMELAVVEALNNAVEHAHHLQRAKRVKVRVSLESDLVSFTVIDQGAPFDFEAAMRTAAIMENVPEVERGRGLGIIRSLMDEIKYERKGKANHITLIRYLKRS
ncbi:MAG TPA: ATP-binding protein [Candidatus Binataceae bacterium]|nr:ATP-binding protein [Candidatus Binataceae bacterium]